MIEKKEEIDKLYEILEKYKNEEFNEYGGETEYNFDIDFKELFLLIYPRTTQISYSEETYLLYDLFVKLYEYYLETKEDKILNCIKLYLYKYGNWMLYPGEITSMKNIEDRKKLISKYLLKYNIAVWMKYLNIILDIYEEEFNNDNTN